MTHRVRTLLVAAFSLAALGPTGRAQEKAVPPAAAQFFENKVRPVLAEHCFSCHGEKKQRGSLRLDSLAAILEGGDQGPALVAGHPEKSLLVKAIGYEDKDLKMPPSKKLAREQAEVLTQWVKMGAPWPGGAKVAAAPKKGEFQITEKDRQHWSFRPIKRPPPPAVKGQAWVKNPIDAFILAGLEAKGLKPNPPASPRELVRRLYYDLTGLPPTPQEAEAFVKDASPQAYERLVDKLLESPRFGEKWGRHWLDLVRYAETNSYERDNPKPNVWRYRDYVIRAFNQDKPFDLFVKEQLAGDELGRKDGDALIATGYYRLGIWDDEPSDPLQARYDMLDDIVATTGQVFLGLTLDCARCHNHKIDPIAQKDYYRFLAFFHNINHYRNGGPTDERPIFETDDQVAAYERQVQELDRKRNDVQAKITAIEREFRTKFDKTDQAAGGDLDDLRYRFYRGTWMRLPDFAGLKHEDEGRLPRNLFDISPRSRNDAFGFVFEGTLIVPEAGQYTFFLDSDDGARLSVNGKQVIEYDGIHSLGKEKVGGAELPKGRVPIRLEYFQNVFGLGLQVAWSGPGFSRRLLSAREAESFEPLDFAQLFKERGTQILGKERVAEYVKLRKSLEALKKAQPGVERALCVTEAGVKAPETFVMVRGNPHVKGDKVEPGFPFVFNIPDPPAPSIKTGASTSGRRTILADWLTSKDNPLTSRVMVNRLWQNHFGRGIVRSPNDFGFQGNRPTHPELLDWLAAEFMDGGWRMKRLHKLILTSNAYQMSSRGNDQALAADPANDLLWRVDMRRLGAEEIRDSILAVSGNLNLKMYGPPVFPEIPKEVLQGQSQPGRGWSKSSPEEAARRSVYVHVKRSLLLPILESFDTAETDRSTPVRFATTQPTQALGMINGGFLNEQARVFAARLKREAGDDRERQVRLALSLATSRPPTDAEVQRGVNLIASLQSRDNASPDAALDMFCLLVLNLNEFVYLD